MSQSPTQLSTACRALAMIALLMGFMLPVEAAPPSGEQMQSLKEIREKAVVMQRWETSCAAASLATVLTYGFHDPVSEHYVAATMLKGTQAAQVRARGGFSLLDMKRFVEARGYSGDAYQHLAFEDLTLFHAPIVPIQVHGFSHYVVVNAVSGQDVLLADPAFGNRRMSQARFKRAWLNGLAFVVSPRSGAAL